MLDWSNNKNETAAFSLIEVMVVTIVLAVLAGVVVSASTDTVDFKSDIAGREIMTAVRYAKTNALTSRSVHKVVFDAASNKISVKDDSGNLLWNPIKYTDFEWILPNGQISQADFGGSNELVFGTAGDALYGGTIVIQYPGLLQTLTVAPITGKVVVNELRQ